MSRRDGGLPGLIQDHIKDAHWTRIETGETSLGVPDLNGCRRRVEVWVECKATKGVNIQRVTIEVGQVSWAERRARAGGRVFLAVRRRMANPRDDELWLLSPPAIRVLAENPLSEVSSEKIIFRAPLKGLNWAIVADHIFS